MPRLVPVNHSRVGVQPEDPASGTIWVAHPRRQFLSCHVTAIVTNAGSRWWIQRCRQPTVTSCPRSCQLAVMAGPASAGWGSAFLVPLVDGVKGNIEQHRNLIGS